jgi:hypothetical protein
MSVDQIVFTASSDTVAEGSRLNVTAKFRDLATRTDQTPVTVEWSLRDPDDCREIVPFSSVTPGPSVVLSTTGTHNLACRRAERRELTVIVDRGLAGQFVASYLYSIQNIQGIGPT